MLKSLEQETTLPHVPRYYRIYMDLLSGIRDNTWSPGTTLPSEAELCKRYRASRGTIRHALDDLQREGLIDRHAGRPTQVCSPKIPLLSSGFRADIQKKGFKASSNILTVEHRYPDSEIAPLLVVERHTKVLFVERIINADGIPVVLESVYVALPVAPITNAEIETQSLLELIPAKRGAVLDKALESYQPVALSKAQANLLQVASHTLAIRDQAILFDASHTPIYVSVALVRGDKATIVTETEYRVRK